MGFLLNVRSCQLKLGLVTKDVKMEGKLCKSVQIVPTPPACALEDGEEHVAPEVCRISKLIQLLVQH